MNERLNDYYNYNQLHYSIYFLAKIIFDFALSNAKESFELHKRNIYSFIQTRRLREPEMRVLLVIYQIMVRQTVRDTCRIDRYPRQVRQLSSLQHVIRSSIRTVT